jgi:tetrahydromethanopterin S-methyltransferase subunit F
MAIAPIVSNIGWVAVEEISMPYLWAASIRPSICSISQYLHDIRFMVGKLLFPFPTQRGEQIGLQVGWESAVCGGILIGMINEIRMRMGCNGKLLKLVMT